MKKGHYYCMTFMIAIENNEELFFDILDQYKKIYKKAKLIHGDFSEYNIIIFNNVPYIIDAI
ncbi:RIO1 family regulatory kinase/ATPase domain-containing protein [Candidatus Nanopusillus massiliensis]|uniref:RIO1 family regulatory kinase/ATPase domain-containing protein n=1 Tax=Candidatus Nanopusillus massiliensis TaxID=2897163 RepID=UPI001E2A3067|nr:RIO1 family regulatory kinase/ATPase [Candidatus Nanopusillus massiliensis]